MTRVRVEEKGKEDAQEEQLNMEELNWGDLTWINISPPTETEMEYLTKRYNFHPLVLDDCLSRKQISKVDVFPEYFYFVFHFPHYDRETRISSKRQWSAFIGEGFIVTVHTGEFKTLAALFRDCQMNEESRREYFSHGSGYLLYSILDRAVDSYFPVLDKILSLLEDMEDSVFDEEVEATKEVSIMRRNIITQRSVMFPTRTLFMEMKNKLNRFSKTDMTAYYDDLMNHTNKICETLDECKEIIEVFKDTDYVLVSHRLNRVIRILNLFATVALPFIAISGIYGMNVIAPGGIESGSFKTFIVLVVIMGLIAGGMLFFLRRRRWI